MNQKKFLILKIKLKTKNILLGATLFKEDSKLGNHLSKGFGGLKYNVFNAAIVLSTKNSDSVFFKPKKIYIPFEEYMPGYFAWLPMVSQDYAVMNTPNNLKIGNNHFFISICYESINSFFISDNIQKNVSAIIMMASESFFNISDIYGREQYFNICRLRSIENRKPIIKCSNDGISFCCDEYGNVTYRYDIKKNYSKVVKVYPVKGYTFYNLISFLYPYIILLMLIAIIMHNHLKKSA